MWMLSLIIFSFGIVLISLRTLVRRVAGQYKVKGFTLSRRLAFIRRQPVLAGQGLKNLLNLCKEFTPSLSIR